MTILSFFFGSYAQAEWKVKVNFNTFELSVLNDADEAQATFRVALPSTCKRQLPQTEGVVARIEHNPWWYPTMPTRIAYDNRTDNKKAGRTLPERLAPGDPRNAMGTGKITIAGMGAIRIHGTNAPDSIGMCVSRGCIRLLNTDWQELARLIDGHKSKVIFYRS